MIVSSSGKTVEVALLENGKIVEDGDPIQNEYPDNIFPDEEAPGIRQYGVNLYQSLEGSGRVCGKQH